jgi:hypothetical protein
MSPTVENANGHEWSSADYFAFAPRSYIQIHGRVEVDQNAMWFAWASRRDNDDVPGRNVLVQDFGILQQGTMSADGVAHCEQQLKSNYE